MNLGGGVVSPYYSSAILGLPPLCFYKGKINPFVINWFSLKSLQCGIVKTAQCQKKLLDFLIQSFLSVLPTVKWVKEPEGFTEWRQVVWTSSTLEVINLSIFNQDTFLKMKIEHIQNMDSTKLVKESVSEADIFIMSSLNKNNASPHSSLLSHRKSPSVKRLIQLKWIHCYCQKEVVPGRRDKQGSAHYE